MALDEISSATLAVSPDEFDPLSPEGESDFATYRLAFAQSQVKNILQSYHGRLDAFIETIQNAMDALEHRWRNWSGTAPPDPEAKPQEQPYLRVTIDCGADTLEVLDNGTGLPSERLTLAFVPNFSWKSFAKEEARGHKGVGTTFLAYGHNRFEFHTKHPTLTAAYRIDGGSSWAYGAEVAAALPKFVRQPAIDPILDEFGRGSLARVTLGPGTTYGSLKNTFHNSQDLWSHILRTYTAVGVVKPGFDKADFPYWLRNLKAELIVKGTGAAGTAALESQFHYPHLALTASQAEELQELQNTPSEDREFELIYLARDHKSLRQLLKSPLAKLKDSENPEEREIARQFDFYEVSAYASLACRNTFYDDFTRVAIGNSEAKRVQFQNVSGGILAASAGMPVGEVIPALNLLKPEHRRRFFLLVHFNHLYRPDVGRKMIPADLIPLVRWIEKALFDLLNVHAGRLLKDAADAVHHSASFAQAQEQLKDDVQKINNAWKGKPELAYKLPLRRPPAFEAEVAAIFFALVSDGSLPGYSIRGIAGAKTRYDALFDFESDTPDTAAPGQVPLGINKSHFHDGMFARGTKWLEFKLNLADLLADFAEDDGAPQKKYFEQADLAVVWSVPATDDNTFDLRAIDAKNWVGRNYYGSTHVITLKGSSHRVEVIELSSLVPQVAQKLGS